MFDFKKIEDSRNDKMFLHVQYVGRDEGIEQIDFYKFQNVKFSIYEKHLDEINKMINDFKILKNLLENNTSPSQDLKKHGDGVQMLYEDVPIDSIDEDKNKCNIGGIELIGYNKEGEMFRSDIEIGI